MSGCDLLDAGPYLCVGSDADNTYTSDESLLIDVGGNDTYSNSAGAGPFLPEGGSAYIPVSVNLDLSGDDAYVSGRLHGPIAGDYEITLGQGAGLVGGLGFAVDLEGNDGYSASATPATPGSQSSILAQGAGAGGTGFLFDLEGDDSYAVTGVDGIRNEVFAVAQGAAYACAVSPHAGGGCSAGGLVDLGGGNDAYSIRAGTAVYTPGGSRTRVAIGQGVGSFGVGILYDDGGQDEFLASASASRPDLLSYPESGGAPEASVVAQGVGSGFGVGMLLEGSGDTTYQADGEGVGTAEVDVTGQGTGAGALGVLDDVGGNDRYLLNGSMTFDPSLNIDDSCRTESEQLCPSAQGSVDAYRSFVTMTVRGQGHGALGSGLLFDQAGNDTYRATSSEHVDAVLRDHLSSPDAPPSLDVRGFNTASLYAQGAGLLAGAGVLLDQQGDDSYEARSVNEAHGRATSDHASGDPEVAAYSGWLSRIAAQGATSSEYGSQGALLDLGGNTDRFEAVATNPATTAPDPMGAFQPGGLWPLVQGNGSGGLFVASGNDPQVMSSPSSPACAGYRGYGMWAGCPGTIHATEDPDHEPWDSQDGGGGFAPSAAGAAPSLTLTADTPTTAARDNTPYDDPPSSSSPRVPVGARLLGPGGEPLAGSVVHFDLQRFCRICYALSFLYVDWVNVWQVDAVTDSDGVARASLPLWGTGPFLQDTDPNAEYRITATYDGEEGTPDTYPIHVAQPLALT